ncbi:MAG TPA: hypothetical protein VGC30_03660 [Dokdonella sp.]
MIAAPGVEVRAAFSRRGAGHRPDKRCRRSSFPALRVAAAAAALAACAAARAKAESFVVGSPDDPHCRFDSVQAALDAAAANGPELDYVRVSREIAYTRLALDVHDQSVVIEGGYRSCELEPDPDGAYTDLAGNRSDPLIRFRASAGATSCASADCASTPAARRVIRAAEGSRWTQATALAWSCACAKPMSSTTMRWTAAASTPSPPALRPAASRSCCSKART